MMMAHERGGWSVVITAVILQSGIAAGSLQVSDDDKSSPDRHGVRLEVADTFRLEVKAYWDRVKESDSNFHTDWDELRNLRPAKEVATYSGAEFRALWPKSTLAPRDMWELSQEGLLKFLRQLHPGATLKLHINNGDSLGAYAVLRAYDDRFADIFIRAHAEFVLKEGFFTPGQLAGRLALDRSTGKVAYFRLYLPPGQVNFDVNRRVTGSVKIGGKVVEREFMATDAGFVPRLELVGGDPKVVKQLDLLAGMTAEQANAALAKRFYRFKEIDWVDFDKALALARKTGKPLHVIALGGTLDDESC